MNAKILIRMNKFIFISFVVIIIFLNTRANAYLWNKSIPHCFDPVTCTYVPLTKNSVCGTDGKTYKNEFHLMCVQHQEYGKRINLQMNHNWECYLWEEYGIATSTILIVS